MCHTDQHRLTGLARVIRRFHSSDAFYMFGAYVISYSAPQYECHTWRLGLMVAVESGTDSEKTGDAVRLSRKGIVALVHGPDAHITPLLRRLALMHLKQLKVLPQPFNELVAKKAEIFKSNEFCQRFATVPGIGPVIATALVSSVGDPSRFRNGRQFVSQTGTHSDAKMREGETKLGGITKRGGTLSTHPATRPMRSKPQISTMGGAGGGKIKSRMHGRSHDPQNANRIFISSSPCTHIQQQPILYATAGETASQPGRAHTRAYDCRRTRERLSKA